jgi:uncharacterized membrane protein
MTRKSINERIAAAITVTVCSMPFLYGFVSFVALWMVLAPRLGFDNPPWYPVLLYYVNLFQGIMLPVLAVGQSVLSRRSEEQQERIDMTITAVAQVLRNQQHEMEGLVSLLKRDLETDQQTNNLLEQIRQEIRTVRK